MKKNTRYEFRVGEYVVAEVCFPAGSIEWALGRGDEEGAALAQILRAMSRTQRLKLARIA